MLSEIEGLRNHQMTLESEKMGLESECGSLHGRLNSKTEECQQIQQTLGQKSIELEEALANLSKASETFASLEQKNSSDSGHFEVCIRKVFLLLVPVLSNLGVLLPKLFLPTLRKNCSSD